MARVLELVTADPRGAAAFVTLTFAHGSEATRSILITQGETCKIGRASKSELKNLHSSPNNALFDSAVVSKNHAELRLNSYAGGQVTITDTSSMHGTRVNGELLEPGKPKSLYPGDELHFGDRVVREAETHEGVVVVFDCHVRHSKASDVTNALSQSKSSRTFQVPEFSEDNSDAADEDLISDVSDEEDIVPSFKTTPEHVSSQSGSIHQPIDLDSMSVPTSDKQRNRADRESIAGPSVPTKRSSQTGSQSIESMQDSAVNNASILVADSIIPANIRSRDWRTLEAEEEDHYDDGAANHYVDDYGHDRERTRPRHLYQPTPLVSAERLLEDQHAQDALAYVPRHTLDLDYRLPNQSANHNDSSHWHGPSYEVIRSQTPMYSPDYETLSQPLIYGRAALPHSQATTAYPTDAYPSIAPLLDRGAKSFGSEQSPCDSLPHVMQPAWPRPEPFVYPSIPASNEHKFSIPSIVQAQDSHTHTSDRAWSNNASTQSRPSTGSKRKIQDVEENEPELPLEPAVTTSKATQAVRLTPMQIISTSVSDPQSSASATAPPARRRKVSHPSKSSTTAELVKLTAAAVVGSVGTMAFLLSPLAEKALQWLS